MRNRLFIDGGARIGEALTEFLDEREDMRGCRVLLFECNPDHEFTLKKLAKERADYQIEVRMEALWKADGFSSLYRSCDKWGDLGCTLDSTKKEKLDFNRPIPVKTVSLSRILIEIGPTDWTIVKLDIEGSEYEVIEDLLKTRAIYLINELHIEWHDHFFDNKSSIHLRSELEKTGVRINNNWW